MWGPFILGGLLFLACLYFVFTNLSNSGAETTPETSGAEEGSEAESPEQTLSQLTASRENLRRAYLAAHGGEDRLAGLRSSRSRGILETKNGRVPFLSVKKRPGKSSLTLRFPDYEQKLVVDGDVVWQRISAPQKESKVNRLEGKTATQIQQLGAFFDPVMALFLQNEGILRGIETADSETGPMILVDFENENLSLRSTAFIDAATLQLASRVDALGRGNERTFFYLDYRNVDGVLAPFVVESYLNGNFENRVKIEQIEYNLGIFPATFEMPDELQTE